MNPCDASLVLVSSRTEASEGVAYLALSCMISRGWYADFHRLVSSIFVASRSHTALDHVVELLLSRSSASAHTLV